MENEGVCKAHRTFYHSEIYPPGGTAGNGIGFAGDCPGGRCQEGDWGDWDMRCRNCWHILNDEDMENNCCGDCNEPLEDNIIWDDSSEEKEYEIELYDVD